ncbi:MAG: peroxisome assembly protein (Peroxin-2) [Bogoriella megaspora]|nr:MAG: peroxisome assembly protein (Peroxin-2) [Bogoriella megaspora]
MTSVDFALAQQRLAARRQQREAENHIRISEHTRSANAAIQHLPNGLRGPGRTISNVWNKIKGREGTQPAFRVGQVDAELLDEELLSLLQGQVGEALKYYGAHLKDEWSSEVLLTLRAILFKLTIWDHNASYGAALQGLRYTDARSNSLSRPQPSAWQKSIYGLVTVGGRYGWTKWENWLLDHEASYDEPTPGFRHLSRLTSMLTTTHSFTAFISFLVFLFNGKYRTLLDRILRLRLAPTSSQVSREVSFEYLNRQLVWHAFTEFLLFLLPLVGISRWRRWLARAWRKAQGLLRGGSAEQDEATFKTGGELAFLPERTCAICYQDQSPVGVASESEMLATPAVPSGIIGSAQTDITNPYETIPCGCVYCYVCLAQRLEAEEGEGWTCLRCGELVKECKPWNGDLLEEVSRPGSGKSVGFVDDRGLQDVEPLPVKDDTEEGMEQAIEADVDRFDARSLNETGGWGNFEGPSLSVTPYETDEQTSVNEMYSEIETQDNEG